MAVVVTGWAEDCIVRGRADDGSVRMSDVLNGTGRLELSAVTVDAFREGRTFEIESVILPAEELLLVELGGIRGHPERRLGTVRHRVVAEVGPYVVIGDLHALRGVKPLVAFRHRSSIVPLTAAIVELDTPDGVRRWELEAVGVNQTRIGVIREAVEGELADLAYA